MIMIANEFVPKSVHLNEINEVLKSAMNSQLRKPLAEKLSGNLSEKWGRLDNFKFKNAESINLEKTDKFI